MYVDFIIYDRIIIVRCRIVLHMKYAHIENIIAKPFALAYTVMTLWKSNLNVIKSKSCEKSTQSVHTSMCEYWNMPEVRLEGEYGERLL